MVRILHFRVYPTFIGLEEAITEDMIDAHEETIEMVADARARSRRDIAVGEPLADGTMGIGDRTVVEVTTDDEGITAVAFDEGMDAVCLRPADLTTLGQLREDHPRGMTALFDILVALDHLLETIADGIAESRCLEMVIDNDNRIAVYLQEESAGAVAAADKGDELFLDNRIFTVDHGDIGFQIAGRKDGVMVSIGTVKDMVYPRTAELRLLQTDDIGLRSGDIIDKIHLYFPFMISGTEIIRVEREYLNTTVRVFDGDIQRTIGPHGTIGHKHSYDGNPCATLIDKEPKDEKEKI